MRGACRTRAGSLGSTTLLGRREGRERWRSDALLRTASTLRSRPRRSWPKSATRSTISVTTICSTSWRARSRRTSTDRFAPSPVTIRNSGLALQPPRAAIPITACWRRRCSTSRGGVAPGASSKKAASWRLRVAPSEANVSTVTSGVSPRSISLSQLWEIPARSASPCCVSPARNRAERIAVPSRWAR